MPKPHPNLSPFLVVLQVMAYWVLWLLLSMALLFLFERLGRERYAPGDVPHGHFQILVLQEDGVPALQALRNHQPGMQPVRQAELSGRQGDHFFTLKQLGPDVWQLHADRDTVISTQCYRIEGEGANVRITPLEFRWRNVGHGFIAFLGALPLLVLCRIGFRTLWRQRTGRAHASAVA